VGLVPVSAQDEINQDSIAQSKDFIPIISIADADFGDEQDEGISGLLSASGDVFARTTDYNLNVGYFRIRGYDSENVAIQLNGIPMNDLENGWASYSTWGGLNQATRVKETTYGLAAADFGFGALGGAVNIDTRASEQRKQIKVSYVTTNRQNYNHRLMVSGATGMQSNGWGYTVAASRRWANDGFRPGVFNDSYSYFLGVDRKLNKQHSLNFTFLGAKVERGKFQGTVQEMYDIAGDNLYNPNWGFQNGEVRNSRIARQHQPIGILRHDWVKDETFSITTAISYQDGRNGATALDWQNASDPRPDYYRKLPTAIADEDTRLEVELLLSQNEELRQIRWDQLYDANRNNMETIQNVGGIEGNNVTGMRSRYIVTERRYDAQRANFSTVLEKIFNDEVTVQGGVTIQRYSKDNYQLVDDLLGGDYFLNINQFAERDFVGDNEKIQQDLDAPNRTIGQGERYGYDYQANINQENAWAQTQLNFGKLKAHIAGNVTHTEFFRTGLNRNGLFPDNSFGNSEKNNFNNYGVKAGFSYALDGRNFLVANAGYQTRAPFFRDVFVSARTRNDVVPNLQSEKIGSFDAAYLYNSPNLKGKIGMYYTEFNDQTEVRSFYHDEFRTFVNFAMTNIDKRHVGLELAAEGKIVTGLTFQAALSLGQFLFDSRPVTTITSDNNAEKIRTEDTVYINQFYIPNTPQTAAVLGLEYQTPGTSKVILSATGTYFDDIWASLNPDRRVLSSINATSDFPTSFSPDTPQGQAIIAQEKSPSAFLLNIGIRRDFKLNADWYLNASLDINNILNNQDFIYTNQEQLRYNKEDKDVSTFPNRYLYANGINYYLNLNATRRF
jgi:hypothetical protein